MNLAITGTSSGIGRALAERLLARGHRVWGLARSDQSDLAAKHPGAFHPSVCDVADWKQVAHAAAQVAASCPHLDGLVTCAGLQGEVGRTVAADPERWDATVRTNLEGTFHAIRAFHTSLDLAPRRAKIVCFSGGGATQARPNFSAYGVAKTGVVRLVETIAEEERESLLDINAVAPGAINTRMTDEVIARGPSQTGTVEYQAALKQKESGGGSLDRALGLIEWLLSAESDGISGRLFSAPWDPWDHWGELGPKLRTPKNDLYMLRRVVP